MDNDNKIEINDSNSQRHKDVLLFLNEELDNLQESDSASTYNLEEEYAKTKKHKSFFTIIILALCTVCVVLLSWGITKYISAQDEKITVNLEEFDSLNLKNLLDSVSKVQENYNTAVKNKNQLERDFQKELNEASEKLERDYFLVDSLNLRDKKDVQQRKAAAEQEYNQNVAAINQKYETLLAQADSDVHDFMQQLGKFDEEKIRSARESQQALDSERQVQELEKQELSNRYEQRIAQLENSLQTERENSSAELRKSVSQVRDKFQAEIDLLDPVLKDKKAEAIIAKASAASALGFNGNSFLKENQIEDETVAEGFKQFQSAYDDYKYVRSPIAAIPHKNSAPAYIKSSEILVDQMSQTFASTSAKLHDEKTALQNQVDNLNEQIEGLNVQIETMISDHERELQSLEAEKKEEKRQQQSEMEKCIEGVLTAAKSNAAVISVDGRDNIRIYVTPKARYLVTEAGASVEIKTEKAVVKGKIISDSQTENGGYYLFTPAVDKEGNPVEFDVNLITLGLTVKILAK